MNDPNIQTLWALNLALLMQLAGVALAVLVDPYIKKANRRIMYAIVVIVLFLTFEPQVTERYMTVYLKDHIALWDTTMTIISYILRTVSLYLFIKLSGNRRGDKILIAILAINAAICMTGFWKPWVFKFDPNGSWHRGPLGYTPFIASFILFSFVFPLYIIL